MTRTRTFLIVIVSICVLAELGGCGSGGEGNAGGDGGSTAPLPPNGLVTKPPADNSSGTPKGENTPAGVTVRQDWVARYDGPGVGFDRPWALAVDTAGNVYVTGLGISTGAAGGDYATIKYDAKGNQLWLANYDGPSDRRRWDEARALAVDAAGNVYVTGFSESNTGFHYATVKYDTNGNQLWVARYDGPQDYDNPTALVVDANGNVYVTGYSRRVDQNQSGELDFATVKYDSDGNQLWIARYENPFGSISGPVALGVDASGNVYIAGTIKTSPSTGKARDFDYATIKYDSNGNELWVAGYNGPGNELDSISALAVDAAGNVYVTGTSAGPGYSADFPEKIYDFATIKYDPGGHQLWVARYTGPGNEGDFATDIALDGTGNVYVTGKSSGYDSSFDYATIKYDPNGNQLWVTRYNGPANGDDWATKLAVDATGNVYVSGWSIGSNTLFDYATLKYDSNGKQIWVTRYNGSGNGQDYMLGFAIDAAGNVYLTGESAGTGPLTGAGPMTDYATIKYSQSIMP